MKIFVKRYDNAATEEVTVERAVHGALTPSAYSYDGHLECLNEKINKQQEFISKLTEMLVNAKMINADQLQELLGYGYEVEED